MGSEVRIDGENGTTTSVRARAVGRSPRYPYARGLPPIDGVMRSCQEGAAAYRCGRTKYFSGDGRGDGSGDGRVISEPQGLSLTPIDSRSSQYKENPCRFPK